MLFIISTIKLQLNLNFRIVFDRAWTPFDDFSSVNPKKEPAKSSLPNGVVPSNQDYRVPPW